MDDHPQSDTHVALHLLAIYAQDTSPPARPPRFSFWKDWYARLLAWLTP